MRSAGLSRRGARLIGASPTPAYLNEHFNRRDDRYCPQRNPDGYLALCVAEELGIPYSQVKAVVADTVDFVRNLFAAPAREPTQPPDEARP